MPPMGLNVLDAHVDINMHRMMADHSLHNPALLPLPTAAGRSLEGCGWGVTGVLGLGAGQQMAELWRETHLGARGLGRRRGRRMLQRWMGMCEILSYSLCGSAVLEWNGGLRYMRSTLSSAMCCCRISRLSPK